MIYIEAFLVTVLLFTLFLTVRSDIKTGKIENMKVLLSSFLCIVADVVYYVFFARQYYMVFLINLFVMAAVSVMLYAYNIWAAGDCKLMINVVLAIPGRFYFISYRGVLPGFLLLAAVFSTAFIFIICESVFLWIRNNEWKNSLKTRRNTSWMPRIMSFLACMTVVFPVTGIMRFLAPDFSFDNEPLFFMTAFVLVLTVLNFPQLRSGVVIVINTSVSVILTAIGVITVQVGSHDYRPYIVMLAVFSLQSIAAKHNYKEIPTEQVKQGMILSLGTVLRLSATKIKGLPSSTTEDLRSRLTKEEAGIIHSWGISQNGEQTVVIVRKIPFAIFIAIGVLVFLFLEMLV